MLEQIAAGSLAAAESRVATNQTASELMPTGTLTSGINDVCNSHSVSKATGTAVWLVVVSVMAESMLDNIYIHSLCIQKLVVFIMVLCFCFLSFSFLFMFLTWYITDEDTGYVELIFLTFNYTCSL